MLEGEFLIRNLVGDLLDFGLFRLDFLLYLLIIDLKLLNRLKFFLILVLEIEDFAFPTDLLFSYKLYALLHFEIIAVVLGLLGINGLLLLLKLNNFLRKVLHFLLKRLYILHFLFVIIV